MISLMRPVGQRVCPVIKTSYQIPCNDGPAASSTAVASAMSAFMDQHQNACTRWSLLLLQVLLSS